MSRAALAALAVVFIVTAPGCRGSGASDGMLQQETSLIVPVDPNSASPTDQAIMRAQNSLQQDAKNDLARVDLANAYLQKARETADPSFYAKADGLLDVAKDALEKDARFWESRGSLNLVLHDFRHALKDGTKASKLNPKSAVAYGVLADANNELGNSEEALAATQAMLDIRADIASLSRASYARELKGDLDGAIVAMRQAARAGGRSGEGVAYVQTLLGDLLLTNAQPLEAESAYTAALSAFPGFAAAQAGQAKLLLARDKPNEAAAVLADILKRQPLEEYAVAHGDALIAAGRADEAKDAYALVETLNKLFVANGVAVDREQALFQADHHPGDEAVEQAEKALSKRGSLAGYDVLAWALFTDGQVKEAGMQSDTALSEGSKDPLHRYHAAAIAHAQGNPIKAAEHLQVVLDTNPRFSGAFIKAVKEMADDLGLNYPPSAAGSPG